jgi:hypothetical protein
MFRLNSVYSFHISEIEKESIEVLRSHNINISRFLRMELRKLSNQLQSANQTTEKHNRGK